MEVCTTKGSKRRYNGNDDGRYNETFMPTRMRSQCRMELVAHQHRRQHGLWPWGDIGFHCKCISAICHIWKFFALWYYYLVIWGHPLKVSAQFAYFFTPSTPCLCMSTFCVAPLPMSEWIQNVTLSSYMEAKCIFSVIYNHGQL